MTNVPLGRGAYQRQYGDTPRIRMINRFFEESPTNQEEGSSLLSRPPTSFVKTVGTGKIRSNYTLRGVFNDALFVVSGTSLFRVNTDLTLNPITGTVAGAGFPQMVARGDGKLFIADGTNLQYYDADEVSATGSLTLTGNAVAGETVTIGATTYAFVAALDSVGGAANDVLIAGSASLTIDNLIAAVNAAAGAGTTYGTGTAANLSVTAAVASGDVMDVTAILSGVSGNSIDTTDTMSVGSWANTMLTGGTDAALKSITVPDSLGIVSIDVIAQHVVCVAANSQKFFWILPGAVIIDPLDFAEAEQGPDELISARTVGDRIYLLGEETTEIWYANPNTTDSSEAIIRQQGSAFSRGVVEGTDVKMNENLVIVGDDHNVYRVGGEITVISSPYISEQIRLALQAERDAA